MLRELHISNLAIIADVRIELSAGLNCFTGATGAGKSLVIGAIEILLGLRSPAEMLRPGVDEGRVSGVFEIRNSDLLKRVDQIADAPVSADGGELLITRRLYASGRSSVSLNGNPITLGMLKQIAEELVDVHGQHDHQYLLKPANQIDVIDQFGDLWPLRREYSQLFEEAGRAKQRLADLSASRELRRQQLDLYRFQADEIDAAELMPGEYEELQARASVLQNLEKIKKDTAAVHGALYEADGSVLERLKMAGAILAELSLLDPQIQSAAANLRDATISIEEVAFDLGRHLDRLDLDPAEINEVSERLNAVNRLLSKYGDTIDTTLAYRQEIGVKIAELERATDDFASLQKQLKPLLEKLADTGRRLSAKRSAIAKKLAPLIEKELHELGMEKATFSISLTPASPGLEGEDLPASANGFDQVEFIVQTNPGQSPQPLRRIASGGELGRIMLALKGILAQSDRISVLVFDEIDANVGGRLGSVIGAKLLRLASHHQVLCITHLPQIAAYADRHLTVRKETAGNSTETKVRAMEGADRLQELAEMIGGHRVTDVTRAQAKELLEAATEDSDARPLIKSQGNGRKKSRA
ncbi:MAG TPA: DNA repair protein RecN [Humisphaera sp.]|jgi:DNA repair protein RecN (Recombination protein N)|nr:DNA repair protein RecN [Humisphaera sp.]